MKLVENTNQAYRSCVAVRFSLCMYVRSCCWSTNFTLSLIINLKLKLSDIPGSHRKGSWPSSLGYESLSCRYKRGLS